MAENEFFSKLLECRSYFPGKQSAKNGVIRADPDGKIIPEFPPPNPKQKNFLTPAFGLMSGRPNLRENDQSARKPNPGVKERTGRD